MVLMDAVKSMISRGKGRHLLCSPRLYALGRLLIRGRVLKYPYRATTMLLDYTLEMTGKSYHRRFPAAWSSAFFPTELLHALGIAPFSPEAAAAAVSSLGFQRELLQEAESRCPGNDNCTFHRCAMGAFFSGFFPAPRGFCASSHLCDGAVFLFQNLAQVSGIPLILLDTPWEKGEEAVEDVTRQLQQMIPLLENIAGRTLDDHKVEEAVLHAEEARQAMLRVNELRCHPASPLSAGEAFNYLYLYFTGLGSEAMPRIYQMLARELEIKIHEHNEAFPPSKRLLWLHLPPFYRSGIELFSYLENRGARVVFEEFNHVYWDEMDCRDPLRAVARRMVAHFSYGHLQHRIHTIKELARDYQVDGIIHFSHWGCRQSCGALGVIREELLREGLPLLELEGDCVDDRNFSPGQLKTRLDGFLEML